MKSKRSVKPSFPQTTALLARQIQEARLDHGALEALIRPCEMKRCKATCCYDGVCLSAEEASYVEGVAGESRGQLLEYGLSLPDEVITEHNGGKKTATRVAEYGELADDFPSHFNKTRCVFLNSEGFCGLQMLAMNDRQDPWIHKPLTCWIHPLVLIPAGAREDRPLLTLVSPENDPQKKGDYLGYASCTHCGRPDNNGKPAWQVLKTELLRLGELSGRNIYGELSAEEVDWIRE